MGQGSVRKIQRLRIASGDKNKNVWQLKDLPGVFELGRDLPQLPCAFTLLALYECADRNLPCGSAADSAAGDSTGAGRTWLDEHGHRGHHDGRAAAEQCGGDGRGQPGFGNFHGAGAFWRRVAPRSRYSGGAGLWSGQTRGLSSLAGQRSLSKHRFDSYSERPDLVYAASPAGHAGRSGADARDHSLQQRSYLWFTAPFAVLRGAPLSSGDEHGSPRGICAGDCKHYQRAGQLDLDLWQMGRAGNGHGWFRVVHGNRARLYGGGADWLSLLVRPQTSHRTAENTGGYRSQP